MNNAVTEHFVKYFTFFLYNCFCWECLWYWEM